MKPLPREFYQMPTVEVARYLLGQLLVRLTPAGWVVGRIVETEAYGPHDPANHAFRGKTKRNAVMFGPPGHAYVYRAYGIHYCFNAVTAPEGVGEAVLVRAVEPLVGIEFMRQQRGEVPLETLCRGPGNLCRAFAITTELNGYDLVKGNGIAIWEGEPVADTRVVVTPRIGIRVARDRLWRFVVRGP